MTPEHPMKESTPKIYNLLVNDLGMDNKFTWGDFVFEFDSEEGVWLEYDLNTEHLIFHYNKKMFDFYVDVDEYETFDEFNTELDNLDEFKIWYNSCCKKTKEWLIEFCGINKYLTKEL
jgi:hypothetical protein